jgi:hypothetical protein
MSDLKLIKIHAKQGNLEYINKNINLAIKYFFPLIKEIVHYGHIKCLKHLYMVYKYDNIKSQFYINFNKFLFNENAIIRCITPCNQKELQSRKIECLDFMLSTSDVQITDKIIFVCIQHDYDIVLEKIINVIENFHTNNWMIMACRKLNSYKCQTLLLKHFSSQSKYAINCDISNLNVMYCYPKRNYNIISIDQSSERSKDINIDWSINYNTGQDYDLENTGFLYQTLLFMN